MVATWSWVTFWLILHVLGVLLAFGPAFANPIMGAILAKYPQHAIYAVKVGETIATRMTIPIGVVVALSGTGLIYSLHVPLWSTPWLIVAIALYTAAYGFGLFVQTPTGLKLLRILESMPPGPPPAGGPPPEVAALARRLRLGGMYLLGSIVVIAILMIWQPGKHVFG